MGQKHVLEIKTYASCISYMYILEDIFTFKASLWNF